MLTRTVRPQLAEQYSDMLAQSFRLRNVLLSSYCHTLSDLALSDQRMLTYLEGMLLLKEETRDYLQRQLQDPLSVGEFFAVALFAVSTDDEFLLSGCLGLAQAMPRLIPVLLSTTDWMPTQSSLWPLMQSLPACRAYIAALRNRPAQSVIFSQQDIQALLEQSQCVDFLLYFLCRSASPLFIPTLETVFSSERDELVLQGCRAVICLRSLADNYTSAAVRQLHQLTRSRNDNIHSAAVRYLLTHSAGNSRELMSNLIVEGMDKRLQIQAMGWCGLADYIPALTTYFDSPEYARLSVLSVISITGSLPEQDGWRFEDGKGNRTVVTTKSAEIPTRDPEQGVSWPERQAFERWWQTRQKDFVPGAPYLCGQPISQEGLNTVLKQGYLNLRPLALIRMGQFSERAALPVTAYQAGRLKDERFEK